VFAGCTLLAAFMRLAHPRYEAVHGQLEYLLYGLAVIVFLWFVPALAHDFFRALGGQGTRLAAGPLVGAVWRLIGSVIVLAGLAGASVLPLVLLLPPGQPVPGEYYAGSLHPPWAVHLFASSVVFAAYLIGTCGLALALLLVVRSVVLYRLVVATFVLLSLLEPAAKTTLLEVAGFYIPRATTPSAALVTNPMNYLFVLDFPSYFVTFTHDAATGSLVTMQIDLGWLRAAVETAWRFPRSLVQLLFFVWLTGPLTVTLYGMVKPGGVPPGRPTIHRPVASPLLGLTTALAMLGLTAAALVYCTSFPLMAAAAAPRATTASWMLVAVVGAMAYLTVVAVAAALHTSGYSGLGDSLPAVVRRFLHLGLGLVFGIAAAGWSLLVILQTAAGHSTAAVIGGTVLLLLCAIILLLAGTSALIFGRLTRGRRLLWPLAQGTLVLLGLASLTLFLFLRRPPEALVGPAFSLSSATAAGAAREAARLAGGTYFGLVHSWLRSFESAVVSGGGLLQLLFGLSAAMAALALATVLLARLTRRLA